METVLAEPSRYNVQALGSKKLDAVPSRYVRPERAADIICMDEASLIPVIDYSKLCDDTFSQDELEKFHLACRDWGFFQLVNHGVPKDVLEKVKSDVTEFFKLPIEEKMACQQAVEEEWCRMVFRFFNEQKLEWVDMKTDVAKFFKHPTEEKMTGQQAVEEEGYGLVSKYSDEQKLDWGYSMFLVTQPETIRNVKVWPNSPLTFRETIAQYSLHLQKVKMCILGLMAKNLGIEPEKFTNMFDGGMQSMRINYYPPCPEDDKVLGISPHSDATGITFFIQVNNVQGLQIRHEERWVPIVLSTDAILVNIGDILEILTNGRYKSIEHRVAINKNTEERLSVVAFHELNENNTIEPLQELIKEGEDKCYKSLSSAEYRKLEFDENLDGKTFIEKMKLKK